MAQEDFETLREVREFWKGKTIADMAAAWQPEGFDELDRLGVRSFGEKMPLVMMPAGHSAPRRGHGWTRTETTSWATRSTDTCSITPS